MFQRILVGLDGSPSGRQAFQAALELACLYRASLIALTVREGPIPAHRDTEETASFDYYRQVQANAVEQARAAGLTLATAMRRGHAAQALVEFAQEEDADLIVIGATGHEHPWSLTMGGTAWRVTTAAPCATIVVRPPHTARWVRDLMVRHVSTVNPQTPLAEVVELLLRRGVKAVPVVDERQRLTGIIAEVDLLTRADLGFRLSLQQEMPAEAVAQQLQRLQAGGKTARDVMTPHPRTIPQEANLKAAIRTMAGHHIKHLPVVDAQGQLVGMLSRADVLRAVAAGAEPVQEEAEDVEPSLRARTVGDLMLTEVPTAKVETPIDAVVHLVLSSPSRRVVITDSEGVVRGIITDRRLLARAAASIRPRFLQALGDLVDALSMWRGARGPLSAGDLMRTDVFTVRADAPIIHAIRLMMQRQVKRLVVVDGAGRLQGVVDRQTLLRWLAEASGLD